VGIVRAVGPGKWIEGINGGFVRRTPEVKPGDMVLFNSRWHDLGDNHEKQDSDSLHLIQEEDIYCKIDA
jgi:co-chaperonin GroES (HSP10)